MFNLEQSIAAWRQQMLAAGIASLSLEELEGHLREEIERQVKSGTREENAFHFAVQQIGAAKKIKQEFMKMEQRNRPLAWAAWGLFAVSFFLPACNDAWGWQCAWISASAATYNWHKFLHGDLGIIWLSSLTLANLLMVVSPLLQSYPKICSLKWSRWFFLGGAILVWSYILEGMTHGAFHQLKIGCYAWGASFLLLWLSTVVRRGFKAPLAKYV